MTREQALTMVIASIGMEESALSRIINAEGEKLRYILDRCQGAGGCEKTPKEILEANESVTRLLDAVAQNQTILRGKLALALSAGGGCHPAPPCPPTPPCPPPPCPEKSLIQLRLSGDGFLWQTDCPIQWEYLGGRGDAVRWCMENPARVELDPGRAWSVNCTFLIRDFAPKAASGCICLESTGASREPPPLCFDLCCARGEAVTLPYSALLMSGGARAVAFRLCSKCPVWVEQAELSIIEL